MTSSLVIFFALESTLFEGLENLGYFYKNIFSKIFFLSFSLLFIFADFSYTYSRPLEFFLQLTNSLQILFSLFLSVFYYGLLWFLCLQPLFSSAMSKLP